MLFAMVAIRKPGRARLRAYRVKRKRVLPEIALIALIDLFLVLVFYLLPHFSAVGELIALGKGLEFAPRAKHATTMERAPIISASLLRTRVEGYEVQNLADLTDKMQEMRKVDEMMHNGVATRNVVFLGDVDLDFEEVRAILSAAAEAGYDRPSFAVYTSFEY